MDIHILDQSFTLIAVIDSYESMIWTDRYDEPGEFEIYTPVTDEMIKFPVVNNYLRIGDSEHLMIIEDIEVETNIEDGNHIKIKGRSLESILDRRVIIGEVNIEGNLQNAIRSLITTNIISPSDSRRRISNFIFRDSTDSKVTSLTYETQFKGKNLLEAIEEMCKEKEIGFKVILNDNNQFVFSLYAGTNRSYSQEALPWVVFKPSFDNIIESDYKEEHSDARTFCYVHSQYTQKDEDSESNESQEIEVIREVGTGTGLLRKEVYKDGGVSKDDEMSMAEYYAKLDQAGSEELTAKKVKKEFEGEVETSRLFVYGRDFFIGDVLQVANEYGKEAPSRMTEFVWSIDSSGVDHHPVFKALDYTG